MSEENKSAGSRPLVFSLGFSWFSVSCSLWGSWWEKSTFRRRAGCAGARRFSAGTFRTDGAGSRRIPVGHAQPRPQVHDPGKFLSEQESGQPHGQVLQGQGVPRFHKEYSPSDITTFYRVRIGTFESKEEAREYGHEIRERDRDFKFYVTLND